jgi:hypothetical protein
MQRSIKYTDWHYMYVCLIRCKINCEKSVRTNIIQFPSTSYKHHLEKKGKYIYIYMCIYSKRNITIYIYIFPSMCANRCKRERVCVFIHTHVYVYVVLPHSIRGAQTGYCTSCFGIRPRSHGCNSRGPCATRGDGTCGRRGSPCERGRIPKQLVQYPVCAP